MPQVIAPLFDPVGRATDGSRDHVICRLEGLLPSHVDQQRGAGGPRELGELRNSDC